MKTILKQFIDEPLFDACAAMLSHLHITFNEVTRTPVQFDSLYPGSLTKALQEILAKVECTYFIGTVDEASLSGAASHQDENELTAKASEGKYVGMMIFAVDIKPGQTLTRTELATLTRGFNRIAAAQPVVLFMRQGDRLALATCERSEYTQQWRDGEKLGKVSLLRGINCLHPHRGHIDILESIGDKAYSTFEELYKHWMQVFSSEVLTKHFYNDLFEWYQWAVSDEAGVTFPGNVEKQEDDREDIDTCVIRLITRLMFVWFIKQKDLVPSSIFDEKYVATILKDFDAQSEKEGNYYQAILQNLFFGTLNRPVIEDGERRGFAEANTADVKNLYRYAELFSISENEVIELFAHVPFLNCGLFECLDKTKTLNGVKNRYWKDGFSRNDRRFKDGTFMYRAFVPNILFFHPTKGIISIFNKYVFTIEENTPQDVQVALDPELLGKVFENLLGAYNPETKETARNESGSFYTPREIVQYMVNESLVAHLKQTVGEELEPQYRQLLDFTTEEVQLTGEQKSQILHSLFTCKILDPACGSGAFPMGMLQQMVHILQQVDPDNTQWRDILLNMAVDESRRAFGIVDEDERKKKLLEIEETFNNGLNSPDYTRKLYIIESCIYGVDIQPIAMLISRLRFFITLICEQTDIQRDKPEINFGIKTLPNLESKFVAANTLINADIHQYNEDWTNDEVLALLKNELIAIRRRHFYTRKRSEKIRLLKEDEAKRKQIQEHINRLVGEPNEAKIASLQQQIANNEKLLEMYQGEDWVEEAVQVDLFSDPRIVRVDRNKRERDRINSVISACRRDIEHELNKCTPQGFEAAVLQVTGWNPYDQNSVSPFLDIEWMFGVTDGFDIVIGNPPYRRLQDNNGELANLYSRCGYESFNRGGDIYCLFYERGINLLKNNSFLCFITSNKWMRTGYGESLRNYFSSHSVPLLLIDFAGVKVFDSATVDTNILLLGKNNYPVFTKCVTIPKSAKNNMTDLEKLVEQEQTPCSFDTSSPWIILSSIENSIKDKIDDVGKQLKDWNLKINFGIKTGYNNAFIISEEVRAVILSNCKSNKEHDKTNAIIKPILRGRDIQKYQYHENHLYLINTHNGVRGKYERIHVEDYPAIKEHLDNYWNNIQNRADQGDTPYNLRNCAYLDDFSKPKIVWKRIGSILRFSYDNTGALSLDSTCFATGEHIEYLCCILNSKMGHYLLKDSPKTGTGDLLVSVQAIEPVRVPYNEDIEAIMNNYLQSQVNNYSEEIEKEIDNLVFSLYNLTDEEIDYISEFTEQFE